MEQVTHIQLLKELQSRFNRQTETTVRNPFFCVCGIELTVTDDFAYCDQCGCVYQTPTENAREYVEPFFPRNKRINNYMTKIIRNSEYNHYEKSIYNDLMFIEGALKYRYSPVAINRSKAIYEIHRRETFKGKKGSIRKELISASIYYGLKESQFTLTIQEMMTLTKIKKKIIISGIHKLSKYIQQTPSTNDDYIRRYCNNLNLSRLIPKVTELAQLDCLQYHNPNVRVCGILFYLTHNQKILTQFGMSLATMNKIEIEISKNNN
jgi:hypothetical protein